MTLSPTLRKAQLNYVPIKHLENDNGHDEASDKDKAGRHVRRKTKGQT